MTTVYGNAHKVARAAAVAAFRPGQPCAIGGEPLVCDPWRLDLAHDHITGRGYLGLACRRHNRAEGASRGNRMRGYLRHPERWQPPPLPIMPPMTPSRDW